MNQVKQEKRIRRFILLCLGFLSFEVLCFTAPLDERLEKTKKSKKDKIEKLHERLEKIKNIKKERKEQLERLKREKEEQQKLALAEQKLEEQKPLQTPVPQTDTTLTAPTDPATLPPAEEPIQPPAHDKVIEQSVKPPKAKPKPRPKPAPKPQKPEATAQPDTEQSMIQLAQPAEQSMQPTEEKPLAPAISLFTSEEMQQKERKLSLKLFSILIPTLANYTTEKLLGNTLENDSIANQKIALTAIEAFIVKLTEKLKKIDNTEEYTFLASPNFKNQAWTSELFSRLTAVYLFCSQHLKQYHNTKPQDDQSEAIKELTKKFKSTIKLLEQLCKRYFKYSLPEK